MKLTEHALFFPVLRLVTNSTAAFTSIHRNYGDLVLVRFLSKKLLFVAKPEHIEHVFSQEAKGKVNRDGLYEAKKVAFGDGLANSKGEMWTNQRRIMQPFFNKDAVTAWHGLMLEEINQTVEQIKTAGGKEINLTRAVKSLVQNIIARILFGQTVDNQSKAALVTSVDAIMKGLVPQITSDLYGRSWLKYFFMLHNIRFKSAIKQFEEFVSLAIQSGQDKANTGLLTQLGRAQDPKSGYTMSDELLKDEAISLFIAGQDTTINTVIWFFYRIGKLQAIQDKISEEVLRYQNDPLTTENLANYTYTKAALQETLRHYPAATAINRHPTSDDFALDGYGISPDTSMLVSIYATHHDPKLWEQPNDFYPEHFTNPDLASKRHRFAYLPFGGGIHNCIGRHLAELEMMLIIVSLLREFRFETNMSVKTAISITLKPDRDVLVKVTPLV